MVLLAPDPGLPVEVALDAVRGRWTTLILRALMRTTSWALTSRGRLLRPLLTELWATGSALLADEGEQQAAPAGRRRTVSTPTGTGPAL